MERIIQKRLAKELVDIYNNKLEYAQIVQDKKNQLLFYFLVVGCKNSPYEDGYYIGTILLPKDFPMKPGTFTMLTPSGRFKIKDGICLTNTNYHMETWTPSWSIRSMVIGFISVFNDDKEEGIAHIKDTTKNRIVYAKSSVNFNKQNYFGIFTMFDMFVNSDGSIKQQPLKQQTLLDKIKEAKYNDFDIQLFIDFSKVYIIE